jgi:hypothetical protein
MQQQTPSLMKTKLEQKRLRRLSTGVDSTIVGKEVHRMAIAAAPTIHELADQIRRTRDIDEAVRLSKQLRQVAHELALEIRAEHRRRLSEAREQQGPSGSTT